MADSDTHEAEAEAELRISRVRALDGQDLLAMVTYLLARYPDRFPAMLDDALSSARQRGGGGGRVPDCKWGESNGVSGCSILCFNSWMAAITWEMTCSQP